jgi:hypothetical protein
MARPLGLLRSHNERPCADIEVIREIDRGLNTPKPGKSLHISRPVRRFAFVMIYCIAGRLASLPARPMMVGSRSRSR